MKSVQEIARDEADAVLRACPEWYHSIELAPGIVTPGRAPLEHWEASLRSLRLPDLRGKSVLDIGAYDGFFSFAAERLGAARVVALDHYVWSANMAGYLADWRDAQRTGAPLPSIHESRHWHPVTMPGRRPFDAVRTLFDSKVEPIAADFMAMDLSSLGQFDVVLYLGVLYHMEDPLRALRRVASVTAPLGLAVIETEAMEIASGEEMALCEFFPGAELNNDPTNWWAPNARALAGLCRAAGFREVTMLTPPPRPEGPGRAKSLGRLLGIGTAVESVPTRYRAFVHARP